MLSKLFLAAGGRTVSKCKDDSYKDEFKERPENFQRNRKLPFPMVCLFILKGCKRGLHAAIRTFLTEAGQEIDSYSKSAFCQARQKIKPEAFLELVYTVAQTIYELSEWERYHGYRVLAIDGSDLNLSLTEQTLAYFGAQKNINGEKQVQALASCLYDVLNHCFVDARIKPFSASERDVALEHLEYLDSVRSEKDLILMDRGYPSEKLLLSLDEKKFFYLIRCPVNGFFKELRKVSKADEIVERTCPDGKVLKIRVLSVPLKSGTKEVLITNIFDEFTVEDFRHLYHLRWGIETKYNDLKNKLCLESFTGTSPIAIQQDFYASICLLNLVATIEIDLKDELQAKYAHCSREYQLNIAQTIDLLKEKFVRLVIEDSDRKRKKMYAQLEKELLNCVVSSPQNRSFSRNMNLKSARFHANRKLYGC